MAASSWRMSEPSVDGESPLDSRAPTGQSTRSTGTGRSRFQLPSVGLAIGLRAGQAPFCRPRFPRFATRAHVGSSVSLSMLPLDLCGPRRGGVHSPSPLSAAPPNNTWLHALLPQNPSANVGPTDRTDPIYEYDHRPLNNASHLWTVGHEVVRASTHAASHDASWSLPTVGTVTACW
jgi:hypothetical protein